MTCIHRTTPGIPQTQSGEGRPPRSRTLVPRPIRILYLFLMIATALAAETTQASEVPFAGKARLQEAYGKLPLSFEANQGQTDSQVKFISRRPGSSLFLTPTEAMLTLAYLPANAAGSPAQAQQTVLHMRLQGSNPRPSLSGVDELPGRINYFIGSDPTKWRTNVHTYSKVQYQDIYPGIDMIYYGNQRQLEYDFVVRPGADPKPITLDFQGADLLEIDSHGDLVLHTTAGAIRQRKPMIYQEVHGVQREVPGGYVLKGKHQVGFQVGPYDTRRPLVIDPTLFYSTYLGGSGDDDSGGIGVDSSGNAYVTGTTTSLNFPTSGASQTTLNGVQDVFVTKLNPTGSALVYSTYLGGSGNEQGRGIAVDASGNAYVTGITKSSNFPTTPGAFKTTLGSAFDNGFVTKLDPTGSMLVYSTYLGGSSVDWIFAIAIDTSGNAYVTGKASSGDFPTTSGVFEPVMLGSGGSAFVTKLNSPGSALAYSTFLDAVGNSSVGIGIAVDSSGNAYVTGSTTSGTYPTTPGAFQTTFGGGGNDTFVTKLSPTGSALVYSTLLGGGGSDNVQAIAVDGSGNAFVTGVTNSLNFPTTAGALQTAIGGSSDVFVTKVNATGTGLAYSTYLGGNGPDTSFSIAVDASDNAYVTGVTGSNNFPVTPGAIQSISAGGDDVFVAMLNPAGSGLVYSTYLGGISNNDIGHGIAVDQFANAYVTGLTLSPNFPTTPGAFQTAFAGGASDVFIVKIIDIALPPVAEAGKVTGGGSVNVPGGKANFGFIVQREVGGGPVDGHISYDNHVSGAKVRSVGFTSLTITGNTATFGGTCTNNGVSCTFTVTVTDNGEPGDNDSLTISVLNGSPEGGTLRSGNIQIH